MSHLVVDRRARKRLTWERASVDRRAAMRTASLAMLCAVAAGMTAIVECDGANVARRRAFKTNYPIDH